VVAVEVVVVQEDAQTVEVHQLANHGKEADIVQERMANS